MVRGLKAEEWGLERNPTDLYQSCHKADNVDGPCGGWDVRGIRGDKQIGRLRTLILHYIHIHLVNVRNTVTCQASYKEVFTKSNWPRAHGFIFRKRSLTLKLVSFFIKFDKSFICFQLFASGDIFHHSLLFLFKCTFTFTVPFLLSVI